ncbi:MAG: hypothetical protein K2Y30_01860 [Flavobacteriaceae bacterium]|nr:hypothetical protein [Flavobacteriaceae bacterium]
MEEKELDFMEKRLISTLSVCSIFTFSQIEYVYRKTKSFDKTILCLKLSSSGIPLSDSILQVVAQ